MKINIQPLNMISPSEVNVSDYVTNKSQKNLWLVIYTNGQKYFVDLSNGFLSNVDDKDKEKSLFKVEVEINATLINGK